MLRPLNRSLENQDAWQFVAACILALSLMVIDENTQMMRDTRTLLASAIYPLEALARLPVTFWSQMNQGLTSHAQLIEENNRLRMQLLLQANTLQESEKLRHENDRLRMLLGAASRINKGKLLVSFVLDHDSASFRRMLQLNKGLREKVRLGTAVVDAYGLMGQVTDLSYTTSQVMLITDTSSQLPVRIVRTGARAILQGMGTDELQLKFLPTSSPIQEGDLIETSGLDGHFPNGIPVAVVTSAQTQTGSSFWQVTAESKAKLNTSREVLLLMKDQLDTSSEETNNATN